MRHSHFQEVMIGVSKVLFAQFIAPVIPYVLFPSVSMCAGVDGVVPDLGTIAKTLYQQDNAWDDLNAQYACAWWMSTKDGSFALEYVNHYRWIVTRADALKSIPSYAVP